MLWTTIDLQPQKDVHVAFRGVFELPSPCQVELHTLGASWYVLWLDDRFLLDGPPRHEPQHPEYQVDRLALPAGRHVLAVQVHEIGEGTERHPYVPPFLYCRLFVGGAAVPVRWRCRPLAGYQPGISRISPQHGWVEWCDTAQNPAEWQQPGFDDDAWAEPVQVTRAGKPVPNPAPDFQLASGDVLVLVGTHKQLDSARAALERAPSAG
jgi:hypothetical protein